MLRRQWRLLNSLVSRDEHDGVYCEDLTRRDELELIFVKRLGLGGGWLWDRVEEFVGVGRVGYVLLGEGILGKLGVRGLDIFVVVAAVVDVGVAVKDIHVGNP
jgi:hypothetical protein